MNRPPAAKESRGAAFSLTEVVVALGVATVAIVSILALFPVGFDTVRESAAETQAAVLARTIANDLRAGVRERGFTKAIFVQGTNIMDSGDYPPINLQQSNTYVVAYRYTNYDFGVANYKPLALQAQANLGSDGTKTDPANDLIAELIVMPVSGPDGETQSSSLASLTLRISSPSAVEFSNRKVQEFRWLIGP